MRGFDGFFAVSSAVSVLLKMRKLLTVGVLGVWAKKAVDPPLTQVNPVDELREVPDMFPVETATLPEFPVW